MCIIIAVALIGIALAGAVGLYRDTVWKEDDDEETGFANRNGS